MPFICLHGILSKQIRRFSRKLIVTKLQDATSNVRWKNVSSVSLHDQFLLYGTVLIKREIISFIRTFCTNENIDYIYLLLLLAKRYQNVGLKLKSLTHCILRIIRVFVIGYNVSEVYEVSTLAVSFRHCIKYIIHFGCGNVHIFHAYENVIVFNEKKLAKLKFYVNAMLFFFNSTRYN